VPNPPRTPTERFAALILWLSLALDGHSTWGRLARPLGLLILDRIREINQRFARIAARIGAGTYVPRRAAAMPRRRTGGRPRRPNPLPQGFAWLVKLVQETAVYGSQLQALFRDPEMAALLAAAPAPLRRPLRSLCRMLGVAPPPILATPARAAPAPAPPPAAPAVERPAPPPRRPGFLRRPASPPTPRVHDPPLPRPA
jgi:hypothetical protein